MKNNIQIQFVPIEKCEFNIGQIPGVPGNPRTRENKKQKSLEKSIEELPEMTTARAALVYQYNDKYVVIGGNRRLEAQQSLGCKEIPVIVLPNDITPEKLRRIVILDNEQTGQTDWDKMAAEWDINELKEWNVDMPKGWEVKATNIKEVEPVTDVEDITQRGDVYILGNHRLMCGDSTNEDDVFKLTAGTQVDMLLTDPPYNVDYVGKTKKALKIKNDKMSNDGFYLFLHDAFDCAQKVMKPGAPFYIWHASLYCKQFIDAIENVGLSYKQMLIWKKNTIVMGRMDYHYQHEPCLYGWKPGASHYWNVGRDQSTVMEYNKPNKNELHPTMKPIELFARLIGNSTPENGIVLDIFGGSGTSIMACEQLNRRCLTMELDPHYCDVIIKRWESLTKQKAIKL